MFNNLHNHSHYSIMDGFAKIPDMVSKAKELGYKGLALTDHGTVAGLLDFYGECKKQGIKPILGCEFYIEPVIGLKERNNIAHLILLAKNSQGYKNLLQLNTLAHENMYYKPRLTIHMLKEYSEGLICTTACMGGLMIRSDAEEWLVKLKNIFGKDFYLEIQANSMPEQHDYNLGIVELSQKYNVEMICTIDSHYVNKEDAPAHRLWKQLDKESEYYTTDDYYLMDEAEIRQRLAYLPDSIVESCIKNTRQIWEGCNIDISFKDQHYPKADIVDAKKYIIDICIPRLKELGLDYNQVYIDRFNYELGVLEQANYLDYFILIHTITSWADDNGVLRGVGRGSCVASLVSYLMNITMLDPIKYNLIFERFVHLHRVTAPDIDLDFQSSRRQDVINFIREKFPYTTQVRTVNYMSDKAAIQRAGQALKMVAKDVDKVSASGDTIESMKGPKELKDLASKFLGYIQNFGCHASAIIVTPDKFSNYFSIEKQKENTVTSFAYHEDGKKLLEDMGILKLDILGLSNLDVIDECCKLATDRKDRYDKLINRLYHLRDTDEHTFAMLREGKTAGCFQIESVGMTDCLVKMKPTSVHDLINIVALYRPGPKDAGMIDVYLKNRDNNKIEYLHPKLEPILKDTWGIILFQEQILQIAKDLCGYSLAEGDMLRRVIGRKEVDKMDGIIGEFIQRGVKNGIEENIIREIASQIVTFALYGFNRGHSAAYGYICYQTAILKAHYPAQFFCALLNSKLGDREATVKYIDQAKSMGIKIMHPDIILGANEWQCIHGVLIVGFATITGINNLKVTHRTDDIFDFICQNSRVNNTQVESLIKVGAFGRVNSDVIIPHIEEIREILKRKSECRGKMDTFAEAGNLIKVDSWNLQLTTCEDKLDFISSHLFENMDVNERVWDEQIYNGQKELLGFITYGIKQPVYDMSIVEKYGHLKLGECVVIKKTKTKKGKPMMFIEIDTGKEYHKCVYFDDKEIVIGKTYIYKLDGTIIKDFVPATVINYE